MNINDEFLKMIDCLSYDSNFKVQDMKKSHCYKVKLSNMRDKDGWDVLHDIAKVCEIPYQNILQNFKCSVYGTYIEIPHA